RADVAPDVDDHRVRRAEARTCVADLDLAGPVAPGQHVRQPRQVELHRQAFAEPDPHELRARAGRGGEPPVQVPDRPPQPRVEPGPTAAPATSPEETQWAIYGPPQRQQGSPPPRQPADG